MQSEFCITDLEQIENRAGLSHTMREIAMIFDIKPSLFAIWCKDEDHPVGQHYQRGIMQIEMQKNETLLSKLKTSETAIQIHDKKAKEQAFLDMKTDIFSDYYIDE